MNGHAIRRKWLNSEPVIAGWEMIGHPDSGKVLAQSGVDAVVLDWQHGIRLNEASIVDCIESICSQPGVAPLVRVPTTDQYQISHALDAGACGVLVAMVNTPEDAQKAVSACRYSPAGRRSLGLMPHHKSNESIDDYVRRSNEEIICIVMIETEEGVENIEKICDVNGVDGVYIGPYDLSLDMGISTEVFADHPKHLEAVKRIFTAAHARGIATGHHGFSIEDTIKWLEMGATFCQFGSDLSFLSTAACTNLRLLKSKLR